MVARGDTLRSIAVRAGQTVSTLVELNGIQNPDLVSVGQALKIRATTREHLVQAGDTVNRIARALGIDARSLLAMNDLEAPDLLPIGYRLRIP